LCFLSLETCHAADVSMSQGFRTSQPAYGNYDDYDDGYDDGRGKSWSGKPRTLGILHLSRIQTIPDCIGSCFAAQADTPNRQVATAGRHRPTMRIQGAAPAGPNAHHQQEAAVKTPIHSPSSAHLPGAVMDPGLAKNRGAASRVTAAGTTTSRAAWAE
jgi:hypothetical protein